MKKNKKTSFTLDGDTLDIDINEFFLKDEEDDWEDFDDDDEEDWEFFWEDGVSDYDPDEDDDDGDVGGTTH